jgi:hypothetical protein
VDETQVILYIQQVASQCIIPQSENSSYVGPTTQTQSGLLYDVAEFTTYLVPPAPGISFSGMFIGEGFANFKDGCYWAGSEKSQIGTPSPGTPWTVGIGNEYGRDYIGPPDSWILYYQDQIHNGTAPYTSCDFANKGTPNATQIMSFYCQDSGTWVQYDTLLHPNGHPFGVALDEFTVVSTRNNASGSNR